MTPILNPALHAELTAKGFMRLHHPAEWEDCGSAESGPGPLEGHEAFDEYESATERVYVNEGGLLHREDRDFEQEEWEAQMGIPCSVPREAL